MAYVSQEMKKSLAPGIKAVLKKYNTKGSIAVRHHSTIVVTIKQGPIDFGTDNVNEYYINEHFKGKAQSFLNELLEAMKGPDYFDESDHQTDYFHLSHYTDINIGKWDKPYIVTAGAK